MRIGVAVTLFGLAGACASCGQPKWQVGSVDHLGCAAMISAADRLITTGKAPADSAFSNAALVAAMTHLNAYSIPKGMKEHEAFAAVIPERDRILTEMAPAAIVEQAKACVAKVPG